MPLNAGRGPDVPFEDVRSFFSVCLTAGFMAAAATSLFFLLLIRREKLHCRKVKPKKQPGALSRTPKSYRLATCPLPTVSPGAGQGLSEEPRSRQCSSYWLWLVPFGGQPGGATPIIQRCAVAWHRKSQDYFIDLARERALPTYLDLLDRELGGLRVGGQQSAILNEIPAKSRGSGGRFTSSRVHSSRGR